MEQFAIEVSGLHKHYPKNGSWTGSSVRFSAPLARRDFAATCMLQGGATQSSGAEKRAIEPVAFSPKG